VDNKKYIAIPGVWGSDHSITVKKYRMKFLWEKRENLNLGAYGISHPIRFESDF
jgi:hypothetical protein